MAARRARKVNFVFGSLLQNTALVTGNGAAVLSLRCGSGAVLRGAGWVKCWVNFSRSTLTGTTIASNFWGELQVSNHG
jgi:hypothetical protein